MENITATKEELLLAFHQEFYTNILSRTSDYQPKYLHHSPKKTPANEGSIRAYSNPYNDIVVEDGYIKQFLDKNKTFYFREKSFIFSESKIAERTYYVNLQFVNDKGKQMKANDRVKLYIELFPELEFIKGKSDVLRTVYHSSEFFLEKLPFRNNIIRDMLTEL